MQLSDASLRSIVAHIAHLRAAYGDVIGESELVEPNGEYFPDEFALDADSVQTLLERQQSQSETLARLERDVSAIAASVAQMKDAQEQRAAAAAAARSQARRVARAAARPVAAASAPRPAAQLLSIDMWDGKPSVVIGSTDRPDVRFLREGDQQAGVTVRQADPRRQRAVFDVGGELVELARDAR